MAMPITHGMEAEVQADDLQAKDNLYYIKLMSRQWQPPWGRGGGKVLHLQWSEDFIDISSPSHLWIHRLEPGGLAILPR
jgi:hypothetical protein